MIIEIFIVFAFWVLLGLLIGYFTGLAWYWVAMITVGMLLLYDSLVVQAENNDYMPQGENNYRR